MFPCRLAWSIARWQRSQHALTPTKLTPRAVAGARKRPATIGGHPCPSRRLELTRIERCLRVVQRDFAKINATLNSRRDTLDDDVVREHATGYTPTPIQCSNRATTRSSAGSTVICSSSTRSYYAGIPWTSDTVS